MLDNGPCDALGHEDVIVYQDDEIIQHNCAVCGAEWWEDL